ncbi:hypothetical protein [Schleiferilactobacillus perolens]|uniref:Uncharacterized protein n=1 Tax=Schleiferilactobacillus perolens DSM 12744 TaxID=1423792 RepID=A0A0R1MU78_9LACO|nr:hypothetical protein [Schleiferilactobacillus perolens]KRL07883.1 hypothetical protein FD09_GL002025 [Schleiferilactobacillus perolens DSM 12744]
MTKFTNQYKYEPTSVSTVRRCRFLEDLGLGPAAATLLAVVCIGSLFPGKIFNTVIGPTLGIVVMVEMLVGVYGLLGALIWRRHVQRLVRQKK